MDRWGPVALALAKKTTVFCVGSFGHGADLGKCKTFGYRIEKGTVFWVLVHESCSGIPSASAGWLSVEKRSWETCREGLGGFLGTYRRVDWRPGTKEEIPRE